MIAAALSRRKHPMQRPLAAVLPGNGGLFTYAFPLVTDQMTRSAMAAISTCSVRSRKVQIDDRGMFVICAVGEGRQPRYPDGGLQERKAGSPREQ